MSNTYTYHIQHSFDSPGDIHTDMYCQLYKNGIRAWIEPTGMDSLHLSLEPKDLVRMERRLNKMAAAGQIMALWYGHEITVHKVGGFWEEVKPQAHE